MGTGRSSPGIIGTAHHRRGDDSHNARFCTADFVVLERLYADIWRRRALRLVPLFTIHGDKRGIAD